MPETTSDTQSGSDGGTPEPPIGLEPTTLFVPVGFQIFVKDLEGKTRTLNGIHADMKVEHIKVRVEEKTAVPTWEQRLSYGAKELRDGNTVADYNIQREATLHLSLRLRGGRLPSDLVSSTIEIRNNLAQLKRLFLFMIREERIKKETLGAINAELAFKGIDGLSAPYRRKSLKTLVEFDDDDDAWVAAIDLFAKGQPNLLYSNPQLVTDKLNLSESTQLGQAYVAVASLFNEIHAGAQDKNIQEIFGAPDVLNVRKKCHNAWCYLFHLYNKIDTDHHGDDTEINLGGYARAFGKIHLSKDFFSNDTSAKITLFHESMHLGNGDVVDRGYDGSPGYQLMQAHEKMTNADHFAELMRRKLGVSRYPGEFKPADLSGGGGGYVPTHFEKASREASEELRKAWSAGFRLLECLRIVYEVGELDSTGFDSILPISALGIRRGQAYKWAKFWSKALGLTFHARAQPTDKLNRLDLALAEAVIRGLARLMFICVDAAAKDDTGLTISEKTSVPALKKRNISKSLDVLKACYGELKASRDEELDMIELMATYDLKELDPSTYT